jgi:type II secretory pathway component GspD/PulD (secretin)
MKTKIQLVILAGVALVAYAGLAQTDPGSPPAQPAAPPDVAVAVPATPAPPPAPPAEAPAVKPADTPAPTPADAPAAKPADAPATKPADAKPAADAPRLVTGSEVVPLIVIDDVALLDAVKNLARQAGLNFQFDPRVTVMSNQPNVTVRFENVSAEDALNSVLDNYGLTLQTDAKRHISKITIKDPKAEEPLVSHVIQLKYCAPSNLVSILKSTLSPRSQVLPDARTSQMVVLTTEKELMGLDKLVQELDTPTKQVLIEAQLWETAKNPQTMKGIDWSGTLEKHQITFGNGTASGAYSQNNSSTLVTPPGPPTGASSSQNSSSTLTGAAGSGLAGMALNTAKGFFPGTAFLSGDGLSAVVSFLNKDSDTELVATPRAVTLDNQQAVLNVSRAYPIYNVTPGSANSPAGSTVTWTNVGMVLNVTPRIAANDNISLDVVPELSDIADQDKQVINGLVYTANIYGIRRVSTHVMIHSGNTLVMGGLMQDRVRNSYTKVPILGDTPGLGMLFRSSGKERSKQNLIIFVTPSIIEEGDLPAAKPSNFLKTEFKPEQVSQPVTWWDNGKPYDWTKPKSQAAPAN